MSLTQFTSITGTCVPVPGPDMDTDRIIPARFLKCITFDELAGVMFWDERFDENGQSKSHPVDDPRFKGASIILGGSNFGCGSSREHAPQTIRRSGIKAVIAESFAEIFFGNSTGIGLPCVCASAADIAALARHISDHPETEVTIDLLNMTVSWKEGSFPIRMPAEAREALTRGRWDSIAELLVNMDAVDGSSRLMVHVKNIALRSQQDIVIIQMIHHFHLVTDDASFRHFFRFFDSAARVWFQSGRADRPRKGRYRYFLLDQEYLSFRVNFDVKFKTVDVEFSFIKFS